MTDNEFVTIILIGLCSISFVLVKFILPVVVKRYKKCNPPKRANYNYIRTHSKPVNRDIVRSTILGIDKMLGYLYYVVMVVGTLVLIKTMFNS